MSGGKRRTRTSQTQTLNPWSQQQWTQQNNHLQGLLANRPEQQSYTGQLTAGTHGLEQLAGDRMASGYYDARDYNPLSYENDFDQDVYVNPYRDDMIDRMTGNVQDAASRARADAKAATLANGSYGGSRHGVREALIDESMLDTIGDQTAQISYDSFNRGLGMFENDAGRHERAHFSNERGRQQELNNLLGVGSHLRGIEDRGLAADYAEWLRHQDAINADYWNNVNANMGLLGSIPMLVNSTGESVTKQNPGVAGVLGTAVQGVGSLFGAGGLFAPGGIFNRTVQPYGGGGLGGGLGGAGLLGG